MEVFSQNLLPSLDSDMHKRAFLHINKMFTTEEPHPILIKGWRVMAILSIPILLVVTLGGKPWSKLPLKLKLVKRRN